jgi:hypothetical protein
MAATTATTAAAGTEDSFMGMKWSDITKALSNPNVQRGMAQFGKQLSMGPVDPRTGKRTEGVGSGLAGAADNFIQSSEFQMNAAKQAEQKQLYDKAMMEMFKQYSQKGQGQGGSTDLLTMLSGLRRQPGATTSAGWLDSARGPTLE